MLRYFRINFSIAFLFVCLFVHSQTTPTIEKVLNAGNSGSGTKQIKNIKEATAVNDVITYPPTSTTTVSITDQLIIRNGGIWKLSPVSSFTAAVTNAWLLTGNAGTVDGTSAIGTTDNVPFNIRVNNQKAGRIDNTLQNVYFGFQSGNASGVLASANTAVGHTALLSNIVGNNNTAVGFNSLSVNIANANTGIGSVALAANTTGIANTAVGFVALSANTIGSNNTSVGSDALESNTTASQNVAIGMAALFAQSFANGGVTWNSDNVAVGYNALLLTAPTSTVTGYQNTAVGSTSLDANTIGNFNVGCGYNTLGANTTGGGNTAIGNNVLSSNTIGLFQTGIGLNALNISTGNSNTAVGVNALLTNTTGTSNTAIGLGADVASGALLNTTAIGAGAIVPASNTIVLGNTSVTNVIYPASAITFSLKVINTTAGDAATINSPTGRFRKDATGTTFTLTNSFIDANSIIILQPATAGITTGYFLVCVAGAGSATITFQTAGTAAAPSANYDVNFFITN